MKGAFQIAKLFGIPVQVHWTFGLLLAFVCYLSYSKSWDWPAPFQFLAFFAVLFLCVVFHEFGHALTARRFGVETRDIILSPIGGMARLNKLPETPMQEFLVAVAGPMVNMAIALIILPYLFLLPQTRQQLLNLFDANSNAFFMDLSQLELFLLGLFLLNGTLALFNLLPAFPMDGGRILRAALTVPLGRIRATRIAAFIGQALPTALLAMGVWQWTLRTAFIGLFVFVTASQENRLVQLDVLLEHHLVSDIVRRFYTRIYHSDPMERPIEELTHGLERNFLVFDEGQNLIGTLGEEQMMKAIRKKDFGNTVAYYQQPAYESVDPGDSLRTALGKLQAGDQPILPVREADQIIGVLDVQSINSFLRRKQKEGK